MTLLCSKCKASLRVFRKLFLAEWRRNVKAQGTFAGSFFVGRWSKKGVSSVASSSEMKVLMGGAVVSAGTESKEDTATATVRAEYCDLRTVI